LPDSPKGRNEVKCRIAGIAAQKLNSDFKILLYFLSSVSQAVGFQNRFINGILFALVCQSGLLLLCFAAASERNLAL